MLAFQQQIGEFFRGKGVETRSDIHILQGIQDILARVSTIQQGLFYLVRWEIAQKIAAETETVNTAVLERKSGFDRAAGHLPADLEGSGRGVPAVPLPSAEFGGRIGLDLRQLVVGQADFFIVARQQLL